MTPWTRFVAGLALGALACVGCSSIPDVQFTDDAGADGNPGASGDGGSRTTTSGGTSGTPAAPYSCPSNPPPKSAGTCCGVRLCLNCSTNDCSHCADANCNAGEVCCGRQDSTRVDCRKPGDC